MMVKASLTNRLQAFQRRTLTVGILAGVAWGVVAMLLLLAGCMWVDLVLEAGPLLRLIADALAITFGIGVLAAACTTTLRHASFSSLARQLDRFAGTRGEILTGVDLLSHRPGPAGVTGGLARLAIDRAAGLVDRISPAAAFPAGPIGWAGGALGMLLLLIASLTLTMPRLVKTQASRFLDPFGDHPPYATLTFIVEPGDIQIPVGQDQAIRVTTTGPPASYIELVLASDDTAAPDTLPMFHNPDGSWQATVSHVTASTRYFVRAGRARSRQFNINVISQPRIEQVWFRTTPPAHARRQPYEGPLPPDGLTGLAGTRVDVHLTADRPLSGGAMEIEVDQQRHRLHLQAIGLTSRELKTSFEIRQAGKLHLTAIAAAGQTISDPFTAPITVLDDARPNVNLIEPHADSLATPDASLPIVVAAADDVRIARLQLFRSLNHSRALPMAVELPAEVSTHHRANLPLSLADYALVPGDEITIYARVEDNDPAGVKHAETPAATVRIISQADYDKHSQDQQDADAPLTNRELARRSIEAVRSEIRKLLDTLKDTPADARLSEEHRRRLQSLVDRIRQLASAIGSPDRSGWPLVPDQGSVTERENLARDLDASASAMETSFSPRSPQVTTLGQPSVAELKAAIGDAVLPLLDEADAQITSVPWGPTDPSKSRRRSTRNVTFYGPRPASADPTRDSRSGGTAGVAPSAGPQAAGDRNIASLLPSAGELPPVDAVLERIPARYRSRVGAYFQRIVDDIGQKLPPANEVQP